MTVEQRKDLRSNTARCCGYGSDWKKMTPEQRREVRRLVRNATRQFRNPPYDYFWASK